MNLFKRFFNKKQYITKDIVEEKKISIHITNFITYAKDICPKLKVRGTKYYIGDIDGYKDVLVYFRVRNSAATIREPVESADELIENLSNYENGNIFSKLIEDPDRYISGVFVDQYINNGIYSKKYYINFRVPDKNGKDVWGYIQASDTPEAKELLKYLHINTFINL